MRRRQKTNHSHRGEEEGFQLPPIETEQLTFKDVYDPTVYSYNSVSMSNKKRKMRYASSQKPILKLAQASQILDKNLYGHSRTTSLSIKGPAQSSLKGSRLLENIQEEGHSICRSGLGQHEQDSLKNTPESQIDAMLHNMILKHRDEDVGCNLDIVRSEELQQESIKKELALHPEAILVHKEDLPPNTHSHFRMLIQKDQQSSFLKNKYNSIIRKRLNIEQTVFTDQQKSAQGLFFKGNFESGNLSHILRLSAREYNIYVKVDTNTRGHQSWFYFKVGNSFKEDRRIKMNVCDVRRKFRMVEMGQRFYMKKGDSGRWQPLQQDVTMQQMQDKTYQLTFEVMLQSSQEYYFSLVPPYTYSRLLTDIEGYEAMSQHITTSILTHSLTGLSIPILTITRDAAKHKQSQKGWGLHRKAILINGRLHPSQTCSSFIIDGVVRELLSGRPEMDEFLQNNVLKIVPMINPDGVVFGNFRTNYLGDDLNRMFHRTDQSVYPEVVALKELGRMLKEEYKENFIGFFDMHGHSSATNSFVYGPEYPQKSDNFLECRLFPKILSHFSKYFRYSMSEFRLQEYKFNTARGFFFRRLKVPAYTIETSYGLYRCRDNNKVQLMGTEEWRELGREMCGSLTFYSTYLEDKEEKAKTVYRKGSDRHRSDKKRKSKPKKQTVGSDYFEYSQKLMEQLRMQMAKEPSKQRKQKEEEDSDGESQDQDLPIKQKAFLVKSLSAVSHSLFMLPRVGKPTKQPVVIRPGLAEIGVGLKGVSKGSSKMIWKQDSQHSNKPVNISREYTSYLLRNIQTLNASGPKSAVHTLAAIKKQQKIKELTFHTYNG